MWTRLHERVEMRGTNPYGFYRCECGTERWVRIIAVKLGLSRSCGCYQGYEAKRVGRPKGINSVKVEFSYWNATRQKWKTWYHYQGMPYALALQQVAKSSATLAYRIEPRSLARWKQSHDRNRSTSPSEARCAAAGVDSLF